MKKRDKKNLLIVGIVVVLIVIVFIIAQLFDGGMGSGSSIVREFSSTEVDKGEVIDVEVKVNPTANKDFFAIEEYVPKEWEVIDDGEGLSGTTNVLKWIIIEDAEKITYTYSVKAPSVEGIYNFNGIYVFEGDVSSQTIQGDTLITVK